MASFQCQRKCLADDFKPGRLERYAYNEHGTTKSAYYIAVVTTRFQKDHVKLGLLKCNTCNYITDKPIDEVRSIVQGGIMNRKLRCPCCHSIYARRTKKH